MKVVVIFVLQIALLWSSSAHAMELFEDFKTSGKPSTSNKVKWSYVDQLRPVKDWNEIIPGDGFVHLKIDADRGNDKKSKDGKQIKWPFQMIKFSSIGPGHRIEMRAKNTVIQGVASFLFTYNETNGVFDEIDIEIVGDDGATKPNPHPTGETGWTDVRFNAWANASTKTCKPEISHKKPILDKSDKKVSHQDDRFHVYTIDWHKDRIDFLIDSVHQQTITKLVPNKTTTILIGMRHMSWTGKLDWKGTRTMIVDWVRVKPLKKKTLPQENEPDKK
jgi:hypothetical protein